MYVGIHIQILFTHGIQYTERFLRRRRIIQVNQWLTINLTLQNGEILAYLIDIIHHLDNSLLTQLTALTLVQFSTETLLY